jgi:uncharacterized protein (DUF1330 family)
MSTEPDTTDRAYVIFQEGITDPETYLNEYLPSAAETLQNHDAEILVNTTDPEVLEGEWDHSRTVVVEFPSMEAARAWYEDPAYEEVMPIRHEASEYANAVICPAFSP